MIKVSKDLIEEAENRKISNFELAEIMELKKKKTTKKRDLFVSKSMVLIYAHVFRKPIPEMLQPDYDEIIKLIPKIIAVTHFERYISSQ